MVLKDSGWVKTSVMAHALGIHPDTLRRKWADPNGGFLQENVHWCKGPHRNSVRMWRAATVVTAAQSQGYTLPTSVEAG